MVLQLKIITVTSEAMILGQEAVLCQRRVGNESVEVFEHTKDLFGNWGRAEQNFERWVGTASAVICRPDEGGKLKTEATSQSTSSLASNVAC